MPTAIHLILETDCSRYDLKKMFDVIVGQEPQHFTVYTDVLLSRSDFFKAARKVEWCKDLTQPVDLTGEDPKIFSKYLNCVYFGCQALQPDEKAPEDDRLRDFSTESSSLGPDAFDTSLDEHEAQWQKEAHEPGTYSKYLAQHFRVLVEIYLLADRLQDVQTTNLVIDEIVRFGSQEMENPDAPVISLIYDATVHGNPLRKWARDTQAYDTSSRRHLLLHVGDYPADFKRDVAVELVRIRDSDVRASRLLWRSNVRGHSELVDKCRYHVHDEEHPRCVLQRSE